jgi:hypothetical protein
MLCLCVGKPRFTVNDNFQSRVGAFCVNFIVAAAQLFTVLFCLVGWGWSIWWGVIMLKMASEYSMHEHLFTHIFFFNCQNDCQRSLSIYFLLRRVKRSVTLVPGGVEKVCRKRTVLTPWVRFTKKRNVF